MFIIVGHIGQPFTDHGWNFLDHCWRIFRLLTNILQSIILFSSTDNIFQFSKLNVVSRYSLICKLFSFVVFKPLSIKLLHFVYSIFCNSGPDLFSKQLRSSSLHNPIFFPPNSFFRMVSKYKVN